MKHSRWMVQVSLLLAVGVALAGCPRRPSGPEVQLTLQLKSEGGAPSEAVLAETRRTIAERLDQFGFEEPVFETAGPGRLSVRIVGVEDSARVRRLIETSAVFEMRLVRGPEASSEEAVLAHFQGQLPPDLEILQEEVRGEKGQRVETRYYAVEKRPVITSPDLLRARPSRGRLNEPIVEFEVKENAAAALAEATGANIGSLLALVLDDRVVSAPQINARISKMGIIEGGFTEDEAHDLVLLLRSGPLPVPLTVVDERIVRQGGG